nr:unnamed protein product [Callosobruchus analis]
MFFRFLDNTVQYILGLRLGTLPITVSPKKTGFLGFLVCIESLKELYIYVTQKQFLKYILTNKLLQDDLELFFELFVVKGGTTTIPVQGTEISGPDTGNLTNLDRLTILSCGSGNHITRTDNGDDLQNSPDVIEFEQKLKNDMALYQSTPFA